jgi:phage tail sheath gpL-like
VFSPDDAGDRFGFGFQLHRLVKRAMDGAGGVPVYAIPMTPPAPNGVPSAALGSITFAAGTVKAGRVYMRINGDEAFFDVANGAPVGDIRGAAHAAINADADLPLTSAIGIGADDIDLTSKDKSPQADEITITFNALAGETWPEGVSAVVVDMTGGTGVWTIDINELGQGDDANELHLTDVNQGNGNEATDLDTLSTYNGEGNDFVGLWAKTVARPFRALGGHNEPGSGGLTNAKALGDGRRLDRTNGIVAVPGSPVPPAEIGAVAIGVLARVNNNNPAEHVVGRVLPGVIPGPKVDRWTRDYDDRNAALLAGVSPTRIIDGAVVLQNVATFYHPTNVAVESNGYRSQISIAKLQNILWNIIANFDRKKWKGNALVESVADVADAVAREKAKSRIEVVADLAELAKLFAGKAWLYNSSFTIERLQSDPTLVQIRPGLTGFNANIPVILSGEAGIFDNVVKFDTSIAVLLT